MKPIGYWKVKENCINDALKYNSRIAWKHGQGEGYISACKNGWLEECCKHMIRIGSRHKRLIYAFEFPDNNVYVGLTYNSENRKNKHYVDKISQVYKHIQISGLQPQFKELTSYLDKDVASIKEGEFINEYRLKGWNILNKAKSGALGGSKFKYSLELCKIFALECKSKTEFINRYSKIYQAVRRNGWFEICTSHMKRPDKTTWLKERCINNALLFKSKSEWKIKSKGAYKSAKKNGWFEICTLHMKRPIK